MLAEAVSNTSSESSRRDKSVTVMSWRECSETLLGCHTRHVLSVCGVAFNQAAVQTATVLLQT